MKSKWKVYRITWMLYFGLLVIPGVFFHLFDSLHSSQESVRVTETLGVVGGEMLSLPSRKGSEYDKTVADIDRHLKNLSQWFIAHDSSVYYIGARSPLKDFTDLKSCWERMKRENTSENARACWKKDRVLLRNVRVIAELQYRKMQNTLYSVTAFATLFLFLLIYFVRTFIDYRLKEQALHDEETGLYNSRYCREVLDNLVARAHRHGETLGLLRLKIENVENYSREQRARMFEMFGEQLKRSVRRSDIACRCEENEFLVFVPKTVEESADTFEKRVRKELIGTMRKEFEDFDIVTTTFALREEESGEEFRERSGELLQ